MPKRLILCDCLGSQKIDKDSIEASAGVQCSRVYTNLCVSQLDAAAAEIAKGNAIIACQQEREIFQEIAEESGHDILDFIDIRDRAGWTDEGQDATPKMAALVADSLLERPATKLLDLHSEGRCLIVGDPETVIPVATQLADSLAVTVLVEAIDEIPLDRRFEIVIGKLGQASGALGNFTVQIDALQRVNPAGRGTFGLTEPRDGAHTECDIILDLRKGQTLFPAGHKRDGYVHADPGDPLAVARATFEASQLVGEFDKPFHIKLSQPLCAHSRAGITGCSKCVDACPTGALSPDGEYVSVDAAVCAGCGACSALCPSGAITYDAPAGEFLFRRLKTLSQTYENAGGKNPRLLVHDSGHGAEMIALCARFDRGLPTDVIPLEAATLAGFGHAEMLAALAAGFPSVYILLAPDSERDIIEGEVALAEAIAGAGRIRLLDLNDPQLLADALREPAPLTPLCTPILPMGSRRQITRLAASAILGQPDAPVPLPPNAPYGAVVVNSDACTLCLACVSLCPTGALGDNPDQPQLRFQEDACLQCGICRNACPEKAITLEPQLDLSDGALAQRILHEEEPFECVECGKPFGVKSTIDRIMDQLAGKHAMFATSQSARMIQMCDDCRVQAQYHSKDSPLRGAERPQVMTTEDYLDGKKRRDH